MRTGCCGWSGGPSLKDDAFPAEPGVEWFMDYRNADGSVAEMCGNGVRVYAHWLDRAGWLTDGGTLALGTRAGIRQVRLTADGVSVDMGPARVGPGLDRRRGRAGVHRDGGGRRQPAPGLRHRRRAGHAGPDRASPGTTARCSRTG